MKKVSEEWLKAAGDDLKVMEKIASDEHLTHMVAFHAQQCIEKSLKALIEEYEIVAVKIHNLEKLFELVRPHIKIDVDPILVEILDKLYIDARYPGDLGLLPDGKPSLERAEKFHVFTKTINEKIKTQLEKLASPEDIQV
jgi:HEPN domain-containing protein